LSSFSQRQLGESHLVRRRVYVFRTTVLLSSDLLSMLVLITIRQEIRSNGVSEKDLRTVLMHSRLSSTVPIEKIIASNEMHASGIASMVAEERINSNRRVV
jgi:hypothetical protein